MSTTDWGKVRAAVNRAAPNWYPLDRVYPYTTAEAIRRGRITALRGVIVRTRNTERRNGKRYCEIFLKLEDKDAANRDS